MQQLVSIIIPTFNSELFLEETLGSVLAQTHSYWECIIVDDGSTDATKTISINYQEEDNRFRTYIRPENLPKGPSSARNFGIEKAKGEYVVFLDSDDLLSANCLENRLLFATDFQKFDFWIFKMNMFETVPNSKGQLFNRLPDPDEELLFYKNEFYSGRFPFAVTCSFWRRNSLIILGGFDESMRMLEDPDLHLRALKLALQPKTAINLEPDCFYRIINDIGRVDKRRQYSTIATKNNIYFFVKHYEPNNEAVKNNFKRIYNLYVFAAKSFSTNKLLIKFGIKKDLLPFKQILISHFILIYAKLGADKIKGFGYNSLRQIFNNF